MYDHIPYALQNDEPKNKMPFYIRVLPRSAQKFLLRYCTSPVILICCIIFFLIIIPTLLQDKIEEASSGINNIIDIDPRYRELIYNLPKENRWLDLVVQYRKEKLNQFSPYKTYNQTKCIDRKLYHFEYVRLLGLDPYKQNLSKPYVLVIGEKTDVGRAVINRLEKDGTDYAHCVVCII